MNVTKSFDPDSRITWLELPARLDEQERADMKRLGWRWSGYRQQYYCNHRIPSYPDWMVLEDGGTVAYAAERADRLAVRADKHEKTGRALLNQSDRMASIIPTGQPILVGHYSERRDRNYREKIERKFVKGMQEVQEGEHLAARAKSSTIHQEYKHTPQVIARRIQRLKAELRNFDSPYQQSILQQIAENEAELAALGGLPSDTIQIGDYIDTALTGPAKVVKIYKKSVRVEITRAQVRIFLEKTPLIDKTTILRVLTEEEIEQVKHQF